MNPTHEIKRKRCNLEKNVLDNCRWLTKVSSYNLKFTIEICNKVKPTTITVNW